MVHQLLNPQGIGKRDGRGKLNTPGWLASYVYRVNQITRWGLEEIMSIPYAVGLQMIHCDDYYHGVDRVWNSTSNAESFDSMTIIEQAFERLK
jgi:hypothetical protein